MQLTFRALVLLTTFLAVQAAPVDSGIGSPDLHDVYESKGHWARRSANEAASLDKNDSYFQGNPHHWIKKEASDAASLDKNDRYSQGNPHHWIKKNANDAASLDKNDRYSQGNPHHWI